MSSEVDALHAKMIDKLTEESAFLTAQVEEAFRAIPRHLFLPGISPEEVYSGEAIVIQRAPDGLSTSSSSMPAIMATMIQQLRVEPGSRILEIGTGSGYNAALLAFLAAPEGDVTTVDIDQELIAKARENLMRAGCDGVRVLADDGWLGAAEHAPYDRIEVTVGVWDISPLWQEQLREDGILVIPLWLRAGIQASIAFRKEGSHLYSLSLVPCGFMRLRGTQAGPEGYAVVHGWKVSLDEVRSEDVKLLDELLDEDPRTEPASNLPNGWFTHVALEDPGAIQLSIWEERRTREGVLNRMDRSLAVVENNEILMFGGHAAGDRLRDWLSRAEGFNLWDLDVEAIPTSSSIEISDRWILSRPNYKFAISPVKKLDGVEREEVLEYADPLVDNLLAGLNSGDYEVFSRDFDSRLRQSLDEHFFMRLRTNFLPGVGSYVSRTVSQVQSLRRFISVSYNAKFQRDEEVVVWVAFQRADGQRITGLWFHSKRVRL